MKLTDNTVGEAVYISEKSLTQQVYEQIKELVLSKQLDPGQRVSERLLMKQFKVSSTTVKRALQRLQLEGIVEILPRSGTFVKDSFPTMEENTIIRAYLEGLAARFAAEKASADDLKVLADQLELMRHWTEQGDLDRIIEANVHFHELIRKTAGNLYVGVLVDVLKNFDRVLRDQALSDSRETVRGLKDHTAVFKALASGDGALAESRMREHILRTLNFVKTGILPAREG